MRRSRNIELDSIPLISVYIENEINRSSLRSTSHLVVSHKTDDQQVPAVHKNLFQPSDNNGYSYRRRAEQT